jgi:hemoglobin
MSATKRDIENADDIQLMVDTFYKKVLADETIGYIFKETINWETHMPLMYSFWGSMLLGEQTYRSNPMAKHIALDKRYPLDMAHFNRWLEIWEQNLDEHFAGPMKEQALTRAKNIASVMEYKVRRSRTKGAIL